MTDDQLLIPDVDTAPAPSHPIGESKKPGPTIRWGDVFRSQIKEIIAKMSQDGKTPKEKEVKAMFPADDLTHYWDSDPQQPIKSRRKTWNREVRKFLRKSKEPCPLLDIKTKKAPKVSDSEDLF